MGLRLTVLPEKMAICRLGAGDAVPSWADVGAGFRPAPGESGCAPAGFVSITRTDEELSVVCSETGVPGAAVCDRGWRCLKVEGPLALSLTGVLSSLAGPLAGAGISSFAVSTYDTDYLLVKDERLALAIETLVLAGHSVESRKGDAS